MKNRINFDQEDYRILRTIFSHDYITTSEIAKILYSPKDKNELRKKTSFVISRVKKYARLGILKKINNNNSRKSYYAINEKNIFIAVKIGDTIVLL